MSIVTTTQPQRLLHRIGDTLVGTPEVERGNPARPEEIVVLTPAGDASIVDRAVDAALAAQPAWAATPAPARGAILLRAASILASRVDQATEDLVREEGKTRAEAASEVRRAIEILQFFGGEGRRGRAEVYPSGTPNTHIYTRREPLGIVGIITPWNFPIAIPTWKAAPALVSGNAVVVKPAGLTPLSTWHIASALADAGLPPGLFNLVFGGGSSVGVAIATHPELAAISFTGSNPVGRQIERQAQERHARVQLELGGKNPLVVFDDADPALAAQLAAQSGFGLTGQACTATSRVICTPGIHDEFLEALTEESRRYTPGDGLADGVLMGPVVSQSQLETDLAWIETATSEGAELLTDTAHSGLFLTPAILSGVQGTHRIAQEEVFGPVLAVMPASDVDHAIALANDIPFGLSAGVVTNDLRLANRFIDEIQAGIVKVNRTTSGVDPNVPFGGVKESSTNTYREQGAGATDFYTWTKSVYLGFDQP